MAGPPTGTVTFLFTDIEGSTRLWERSPEVMSEVLTRHDLRSAPQSRAFYDRKRAEGKRHTQALIALARRRVNVVWAMLRDGTTFETRSAA
jgi:hypothetical protein